MASDINFVFYSSAITMRHGPINIRTTVLLKMYYNTQVYVYFHMSVSVHWKATLGYLSRNILVQYIFVYSIA